MSDVTLKVYSWLSDALPGRTLTHAVLVEPFREGETFWHLLEELSCRYPSFEKVIYYRRARCFYPHVNVIYKGEAADGVRDLDRKLEHGDEIIFVPMYAGG